MYLRESRRTNEDGSVAGSVVGAAEHRRGDPAGGGWTPRWPSGSPSTSSRAPPPERLPQVALVGRLRQMAFRLDRGREGALRLRLRRLPSDPPDGADRLLVPSRGVAAQGDRAYGRRVAPIPRHEG